MLGRVRGTDSCVLERPIPFMKNTSASDAWHELRGKCEHVNVHACRTVRPVRNDVRTCQALCVRVDMSGNSCQEVCAATPLSGNACPEAIDEHLPEDLLLLFRVRRMRHCMQVFVSLRFAMRVLAPSHVHVCQWEHTMLVSVAWPGHQHVNEKSYPQPGKRTTADHDHIHAHTHPPSEDIRMCKGLQLERWSCVLAWRAPDMLTACHCWTCFERC